MRVTWKQCFCKATVFISFDSHVLQDEQSTKFSNTRGRQHAVVGSCEKLPGKVTLANHKFFLLRLEVPNVFLLVSPCMYIRAPFMYFA